jgi:predicted nucleic acid-binding protein
LIVIDASALLELLLRTGRADELAERIFGADERLHAPYLLDVEIMQALRRLTLLKDITPERAALVLEDLSQVLIERHQHQPLLQRMWELRDALTAYDAAYVTLAEAISAPLVTCDAKLARAHGHRARIELIS